MSENISRKIIKELKKNSTGMTARELASAIGIDKKVINSVLYNMPDSFIKDDSSRPVWRLKEKIKCKCTLTDPIISKFQNIENAKFFTIEDFNSINNWKLGVGHSDNTSFDKIYTTGSGNTIVCDSKSEILMLEYLEDNNLIQTCGGQSLCIYYDTAFRCDRKYFPDIVALTQDGYILIIEVKAASAMDYHANIEKYSALAKYCEQNGYIYTMIDPAKNYLTFEELRNMKVCSDLLDVFESFEEVRQEVQVSFNNDYVENLYNSYGAAYTKEEFKLMVHSLIIYYNWYNVYRNGFKVYSEPVSVIPGENDKL